MVKNLPANAGEAGPTAGLGKSPGEGKGDPLQYSCLGNLTDRRAWWTTVHASHKRVRHDLVTKKQLSRVY